MVDRPLNQSSHLRRLSVDMAFGRQSLSRRRQLDLVCASNDHPFAGSHTALDANAISLACGDFDIAARESLSADLDEYVRTARLEEDGGFRHRWHAQAVAREEHRCAGLPDQQF